MIDPVHKHACERCGAFWSGPDDAKHAVHYQGGACGHMVQVNCVGELVSKFCRCGELPLEPTLAWVHLDSAGLVCTRCGAVGEPNSQLDDFEQAHLFCRSTS